MSSRYSRQVGTGRRWTLAVKLGLILAAVAVGVLLLRHPQPGVKFISREGLQGGAPPCSVAGARAAREAGYDSIRVSLRRTADGVWVLCHNDTINEQARLPDGSELPEAMTVEEHSFEELNAYDFGIRYGERFAGLGLTRAADFLRVTRELKMEVLLEVKAELNGPVADDLCRMVQDAGYGESIWFSAFSLDPLRMLQYRLPKANIAVIDHFGQDALQGILDSGLMGAGHRTRLDCFRGDEFDPELIQEYYRNGVDIKVGSAYTDEEVLAFLKLGINTIEVGGVEHPQRLLKELAGDAR